jgi:RHS repeat-associated protein
VTVSGIAGQQYNVTFGGTQSTTNMQPIFGDAANISNMSIRSITTSYNTASEVLSVNDPTSNLSFVRDNLGRATTVASTVFGSSFSMGQSFDVVGNRTELRASGSGTLDFRNIYSYDKLNRLTEVIQTNQTGGNSVLPKRVTMAYNALGQRTQLARFQSTGSTNPVATTDYTYDTANRLSGIAHKQGTTNLNTYAYTYDPLSRLKTVTSTLDGLTNYTYSQNDQLLGAVNTGVPNESFGYDANGNRNMAGYTTSSDNRMTASPGFTYVYDAEGNLTRRTNTTTGNYTTYTWDHRNRLTQVTERTSLNSLVSEINYEYDAFNRLSRRYPTGGWSTYWVYDEGINPVLEYDSSASPSMTHRYLWSDNVDELLADEQNPGLSSKNTLWALSDHLGSIRDIADTNETTGITSITNHRRYDSTGKRISETNASVDMVFGYTGKLLDETTGLQNNLNRWLDPATGRWISQDPIGFGGGDANLYRYVGNSPTNATDPSGLKKYDPDAIIKKATRTLQLAVKNGSLTQDEASLRIEILKASLGHQMGFNSGETPDPKYWRLDKSKSSRGEYVLRDGLVAEGIHSRVYRLGVTGSNTGCEMAVKSIMLEGLSQVAKSKGRTKEFDEEFRGKALIEIYPDESNDYQYYSDDPQFLDVQRFLPGDRVRMGNHRFDENLDEVGLEGSNVIYLGQLGGQHLFLHMDGALIENLGQLRRTVRDYCPPGRRDAESKYKFVERYVPLVPESIGK